MTNSRPTDPRSVTIVTEESRWFCQEGHVANITVPLSMWAVYWGNACLWKSVLVSKQVRKVLWTQKAPAWICQMYSWPWQLPREHLMFELASYCVNSCMLLTFKTVFCDVIVYAYRSFNYFVGKCCMSSFRPILFQCWKPRSGSRWHSFICVHSEVLPVMMFNDVNIVVRYGFVWDVLPFEIDEERTRERWIQRITFATKSFAAIRSAADTHTDTQTPSVITHSLAKRWQSIHSCFISILKLTK